MIFLKTGDFPAIDFWRFTLHTSSLAGILGAAPAVVVFKDEALQASSRALLDAQQAITLIDLACTGMRFGQT